MRIDVGVLGATGVVGQQLVSRLEHHPWFRLAWVAASERSAGRKYGELPWRLAVPRPKAAGALTVAPLEPSGAPRLVFSALDAAVAGDAEARFASAGHLVVSNARNYRMAPDVPLVIPEVNADHLALLPHQQQRRGWDGAIVTNPNCSTVFVAMVLAALRAFRPSRALANTLQALSGAGHPGVASLDALANVIPYIAGEEEKIEHETRRLLGTFEHGAVVDAPVTLSAQTTRVPVIDGHTVLLSCTLESRPSLDDVADALRGFTGGGQVSDLPSAPARPIVVTDEIDRPQPRLDCGADGGMSITCGRVRACPVLGYKLVALGHNTIRGAAGAALLNAELVISRERRLRQPSTEVVCPGTAQSPATGQPASSLA